MVVKDQLRWVIFQPIEEFNELEFFLPLKSVNLRNMGQVSWALMYKRSASPPQATPQWLKYEIYVHIFRRVLATSI